MVFSYFKKKTLSIKKTSNTSIWSLSPEKFQKQIEINFKDYKIPPIKITNSCLVKRPSKIQLTLPQQFISKYFTPNNPNGLLLYHSIGSGKTNASINLLKHFEQEGFNFLFITRTTLKKDLDKAIEMVPLKRPLPRFSYKQLSNICKRKGENYRILLDKAKKLNPSTEDPFYKTIIVIDEAHKLYTKDLKTQELHDIKVIEKMIHNSYAVSKENRLRLVLMSATPITENPIEIIQLFNLLIVNPKERFDIQNFEDDFLDKNGKFTEQGLKEFNEKTKGLISYLNTSKDPSNFASMKLTTVYTPISEPPILQTSVKDCQQEYKDCKAFSKNFLTKNLKQLYSNVTCDSNFEECKASLKDNRSFLKNTKFQVDALRNKCNVHFEN